MLWIALATAKTLRSGPLTTFLASTTGLSAAAASVAAGTIIGLEYLLGCLMLVGRFRRLGVAASLLASLAALGLALTVYPPAGCGCFGALGTAEKWQRLV
ncbi:MAG: MauE/DoxX family redox-associated membrane protein, partial [Planctomycetota bacterium]